MFIKTAARLVLSALFAIGASLVHADSGRIEINQASVDVGGGFPFTVSTPDSNYLLTSNLTVPAATDAFVLNTSGVVIDLNGFTIAGPFTCSVGSCSSGAGRAIAPGLSVAFGRDTTVRNGRIRGFSNSCLTLNGSAFVSDLLVSDCGRDGISVSSGSIVTSNRVSRTGEYGIRMAGTVHPPTFERNAVSSAGLGSGSFTGVDGGRPSGGNSCDDGSCAARGDDRRYYLTPALIDGSQPLTACASRFHMASVFELEDISRLRYDFSLGGLFNDQGTGPPSNMSGWARSGALGTHCGAVSWSSASAVDSGTVGFFDAQGNFPPGRQIGNSIPCNAQRRVWCIED